MYVTLSESSCDRDDWRRESGWRRARLEPLHAVFYPLVMYGLTPRASLSWRTVASCLPALS